MPQLDRAQKILYNTDMMKPLVLNWAMDINPTQRSNRVQIQGLTKRQRQIADLLWVAQQDEEVKVIFRLFGDEARVVQNIMIATALDEVTEVDLANDVLDKFRLKSV